MASDRPHPTFLQSLIAGGVAGTSVDLLFFPIDTIKTRLQSAQGFVKAGGFTGVYKGVGSVVVGSAPGAAAFFATYDTMKSVLPFKDNLAPLNHMLAASTGEVAACLIRVPTEVIKTRMQTSSYGAQGTSSWAAAKLVLSTSGVQGFYRGFGITVMREIPFTSIQFPLYEFFKATWSNKLDKHPLPAYEAALCGSVAGGIAAAATTPLDVLKTRVMLDTRTSSNQSLPTLGTRLTTIISTEGWRALFAGVVPRTLWISAGGAVFLGAYETVVGRLNVSTPR
ncbi:S-adenosylmethionine transporter [Coprinopsis sp. MPI-PUGE-AT-0042]|nr:S-adenosylmethionine transporter [Coprinopsis sp. MPI-PUGE-AT-0042]